MKPRVLFFDLDDTLIYENDSDEAVILEVVRHYVPQIGVASASIVEAVRKTAHELWAQSDAIDYCRRIQTSSIEGLYGDYSGDDPNLQTIRRYLARGYREQVWTLALDSLGVEEARRLAPSIAHAFATSRAARNDPWPGALDTLTQLRYAYRLAVITNGAPRVQRTKLDGSGFAAFFDPVVVSGEFGLGKPDPAIYHHALSLAGVKPEEAAMVGNSLERDVIAAEAVGLHAIWFNPSGEVIDDADRWKIARRLTDIPALLAFED